MTNPDGVRPSCNCWKYTNQVCDICQGVRSPGTAPATGAVWDCKIGGADYGKIPQGEDWPMRQAVQRAYREITGEDAVFLFSGWGGSLTESERRVAGLVSTPDTAGAPATPSEPRRFRKKPVVVEAVQLRWTNWNAVCSFVGRTISGATPARNITAEEASDTCGEDGPYIAFDITTVHGERATVRHGDWIIREHGLTDRFYPCKPDIFAATYEPAAPVSG